MNTPQKACGKCGEVKATADFHKCKNYKDGLASWCKACCKVQKSALYAANPEKEKARVGTWYQQTGATRYADARAIRRASLPPKDLTRKFCPGCKATKDTADFNKCTKRYDGLAGECRDCKSRRHAEKVAARRAIRETGESLVTVTQKRCAQCRHVKAASFFFQSVASKDGLGGVCAECSMATRKEWVKRMPVKSLLKARGYCAKRRAIQIAATIGSVDYYEIATRDNFTCYLCGKFVPVGAQLHFDHVIPLSKGGAHSPENIKVSCAPCNLKKGAKWTRS